jgi:hypothetical protein
MSYGAIHQYPLANATAAGRRKPGLEFKKITPDEVEQE